MAWRRHGKLVIFDDVNTEECVLDDVSDLEGMDMK